MEGGTGPDLLSQCVQDPGELQAKDRNGKGIAGVTAGHGAAVQGARGPF